MALLRREAENEQATPCERCDKPARHECWDHPVCEDCASDWYARSPLSGELNKSHGMDNRAAGWREWTGKWLQELKRGAA